MGWSTHVGRIYGWEASFISLVGNLVVSGRPLSVPFLIRTSGKGESHSQAGSATGTPDFG